MTTDGSSAPGANSGLALPPPDHVARGLMMRGKRAQAIAFLHAVIARDVAARPCGALLQAIKARPEDPVRGPDIELSFNLIQRMVHAGWIAEALALLDANVAEESGSFHGQQLRADLTEILADVPAGTDGELGSLAELVRHGSAPVALHILDRAAAPLPAWAARRRELLNKLLRGSAPPGPTASEELKTAVQSRLSRGDLQAAVDTAKSYHRRHPEHEPALRIVQALTRLIQAIQDHSSDVPADRSATASMSVQQAAVLQLRMGNLELAERMCRRAVMNEPLDAWSQDRLADLEVVRRALDGARLSSWPPGAASPGSPQVEVTGFEEVTRDVQTRRRPISSRRLPKVTLRDHDAQELLGSSSPPPPPDPLEREEADSGKPAAVRHKPKTSSSVSALLDKKSRPVAAVGHEYAAPTGSPGGDEPPTVLGPQELHAELLLKQGYAVQALAIYEELALQQPSESRFRGRVEEIRGFISARQTSLPEPGFSSSVPPKGAPVAASAPPPREESTIEVMLPAGDDPITEEPAPRDADPVVLVSPIIVVS